MVKVRKGGLLCLSPTFEERLAVSRRAIERARNRITYQQSCIQRMEGAGLDTGPALALLRRFEQKLEHHVAARQSILKRAGFPPDLLVSPAAPDCAEMSAPD